MTMTPMMGTERFKDFERIWRDLRDGQVSGACPPSDIFVPCIGNRLLSEGKGIYAVGIATNAEEVQTAQDYETRLLWTQGTFETCVAAPGGRPFWRFLDGLSERIYCAPLQEVSGSWGWSNLLKIAGDKGESKNWGNLVTHQLDACFEALNEEWEQLENSVILVLTAPTHGLLERLMPQTNWHKEYSDLGIYHGAYGDSSNRIVHCYHPGYMARAGLIDGASQRIAELARDWFAQSK